MGANEMQISLFNYNYMASRENFEGFLFWRKILERNRGAIVTDRELRRLGRRDLLELLVALGHERDALKAELENRQLKIDRAGSIAEAALQVNGVFESA